MVELALRPHTNDASVFQEIVLSHCYERGNRRVQRGDEWIDIGCHIGIFSWYAQKRGATVIAAYEPVSELATLARQHINNVIEQAVGAEGGITKLYCREDGRDTRNTILPCTNRKYGIRSVPVVSFVEVVRPGACVKMDAEGAEMDILDSSRCLDAMRQLRRFVFEYHFDKDRSREHYWQRMGRLREVFDYVSAPRACQANAKIPARIVIAWRRT